MMFAAIRTTALAAAALGLCAGVAVPAQAAYIVSLQQVGTNVVATGSGSINTTGLTFAIDDPFPIQVFASVGYLGLGQTGHTAAVYTGPSGPVSFGSGGGINASTGSGSIIGIEGTTGVSGVEALGLPETYVSGTALGTSTDTWNGTTLAALGVTDGTYTWTWGSGVNADSYTLQIGPVAAAPEPATLAVLGVGLLGLVAAQRRRITSPRH